MSTQNPRTWKAKAEQKYKQCQSQIPEEWRLPSELTQDLVHPLETSKNDLIELGVARRSGILTAKEVQITEEHDVQQLLKALAAGKLTAFEVAVAFCKRAAIAQQLV